MKLAPYWNEEALIDAVMVNSPADEPMELSLSRLAAAIRWDDAHGLGGGAPRSADEPPVMYTPLTVWLAYTHHPSLSKPYILKKTNHDKRRKE